MNFANLPGGWCPYPIVQCPPGDARLGDGTARPIGFTRSELAYIIFRVKFWTFTSSLAWGTYTPYMSAEQLNYAPLDWWNEHEGDARYKPYGWQGSYLLAFGKLPNGNVWCMTPDPDGIGEGDSTDFASYLYPTGNAYSNASSPYFTPLRKYAALATGSGTGLWGRTTGTEIGDSRIVLNLFFDPGAPACTVLFDGTLYWPEIYFAASYYYGGRAVISTRKTGWDLGDLSDPVGTFTLRGKTCGIYGYPASGTYPTDGDGGTAPIPPALTGDFAWVADSEW
jgi:hypothetical protein